MHRDRAETNDSVADRVVDRVGGHPSGSLGLDLDSGREDALWGWLLACVLLQARAPERVAIAAARRLSESGLATGPQVLADVDPLAVASLLAEAGLARAEEVAALLVRLARGLQQAWAGSLAALYAGADGFEELGERLARLAPGFGRAAAGRFLRGLRSPWPLAADLPLDPAALASAVHLGLLEATADVESAPAQLRRRFASREPAGGLRDLEAALERLGRAACRRGRPERCLLGEICPVRSGATSGGAGPDAPAS